MRRLLFMNKQDQRYRWVQAYNVLQHQALSPTGQSLSLTREVKFKALWKECLLDVFQGRRDFSWIRQVEPKCSRRVGSGEARAHDLKACVFESLRYLTSEEARRAGHECSLNHDAGSIHVCVV